MITPSPAAAQTVESTLQNYCRPSIGAYVIPNPRGTGEIACGTAPNICGIPYDLNGDGLVRDSAGNPVNWQAVDDCWNSGARPNERCNGWGMCYGEVPTCCYLLEETGDPFKCAYPDRLYCLPQQCNRIPANVNNQNCGFSIGTWCQNDCGISRSNIPYIPLAQRLNPSAPTATPTPIGQPPTATPPATATNTPVPPTPTSGVPNTPIPPACTPGGGCTEALKQAGDYNCDCIVDTPDYTSWLTDYISQAWNISLRYFEYWRRAFFSGGGVLPPLPTPDPSCTVVFQWSQSGGIVRTATSDPAVDDLLLNWIGGVAGASGYHVKITASDGTVFADQDAAGFFQATINSAETYTIVVTAVGTCAILTGTSAPLNSAPPTPTPIGGTPPTPTIDPAVSCNGLGNIGGTYGDLPVSGSDGRRADIHADKNLAVRGWVPTITTLGLVDLSGPVDPAQPPQLYRLFGDSRTPQFTNNYKVYDWDWNVQPDGARGAPLSLYDSTLAGMGVTRGERIFVPDSAYQLTGGYEVVVHYVDQDSISMHYRERDTVSGNGYTIHIDGVCIDQNLITKYNSLGGNNGTRIRLPALQAGQAIGEAAGTEIRAAVVDTGEFQDPRSRKDWWQGR